MKNTYGCFGTYLPFASAVRDRACTKCSDIEECQKRTDEILDETNGE